MDRGDKPAGNRTHNAEDARTGCLVGGASAQKEREQHTGGEELELDEVVGPLAAEAVKAVPGIDDQADVGEGHEGQRDDLEPGAAAK